MNVSFEPSFFKGNREKLKELFIGKAPIVLTANGMLQSSSDMTFPFRQDRNFWYLTGIDEPDVILVMDKDKEYLILSEDHPHRVRFEGGKTDKQIAVLSGIDEVLDFKEGWRKLKPKLKRVRYVATLAASPSYVPYYGFYSNPARAMLIKRIKAIHHGIELLDLRSHFVQMRTIKQPTELDAMKRAMQITQKTLSAVTKKISSTTTEQQLSNEITYQFLKQGADGLAFDNVVAAGPHTSVIHHIANDTLVAKTGTLLLDVGAEFDHYAADVSRFYSIGRPSKRVKQVYECVAESLETAMTMLKPGIEHKQFEQDMEHVVGEKLRELSLIKNIDRSSVRKYFPTYTAHQLGLDAHDISDTENTLKANMVLAVEPGIYIPEEGIGIRIEQNVLITDKGNELMTKSLSPELTYLNIK